MDPLIDNTTGARPQAMAPTAETPPQPIAVGGGSRGARRLGRGLMLLVILAGVAFGPYVVGQLVYQIRYNELKAGSDFSIATLAVLNSRPHELEVASRLIALRVEPSVVSVLRPVGGGGRLGQGSGVIVDPDGYIVTNYHVVTGPGAIQVQLSDGRRTSASVVGADPMTDLAVLKIELRGLIAADWGDSDELQLGDFVWALGSPFGLDRSLTFGIVSAKSRRSGTRLTRSPYQEYLQTDAAVNPGNSGGPLVNIKGEIIGINAAILGTAYQGISFAIPSSMAQEKYEELREKGWVDRAWLGIEPRDVPDRVRERLGLQFGEGVYVGNVEREAPAERAGIGRGDVILRWNDHAATDPTLLSRAIAATEIGSTAKVLVARGDEQLEMDVHVERAPWAIEPE